jgi:hypothetical protein
MDARDDLRFETRERVVEDALFACTRPHAWLFADKSIDRRMRSMVWCMTNGRCFDCGRPLNPFANFCVDHIIPVARGGTADLRNLAPCCTSCNSAKGTHLLIEWRSAEPFWFESEEYARDYEWRRFHTIQDWCDDQKAAPDPDGIWVH